MPRFECGDHLPGDPDFPVEPPVIEPGTDEPGGDGGGDDVVIDGEWDADTRPGNDTGDGGPPTAGPPDITRPPDPPDDGDGGGGGGAPGIPGSGQQGRPDPPVTPPGVPDGPAPAPGFGQDDDDDDDDGPINPTTPGAGTQQGGVSYDICYRWVCQNGRPVQIGRTLNYWRNFTGLNLKSCGDLPSTFTGSNEKLYSTNPAAVCPPGNLGGGVLIDSGGGGNNTPIDDPGNIADGGLFDDGGNDGPDAAGGLGGFDFEGPDPPGNLGGFQTGIDTGGGGGGGNNTPIDDPGNIAGGSIFGGGGDNDGPNAAGGLGGFDFEGPTPPGNLGGFQTGIDTGGGDQTTGPGTRIDPPGGVANGGIFNDGPGDGGGPNAAGGLGGFDFEGPTPPGNLGGFQTGIDTGGGGQTTGPGTRIDPPGGIANGGIFNDGPGDGGGPNAAGGLGGFDFEGPTPPGNLGGFQTGIDTGGGQTTGPGTRIDPPGGVANGGIFGDGNNATRIDPPDGTAGGVLVDGGGGDDPFTGIGAGGADVFVIPPDPLNAGGGQVIPGNSGGGGGSNISIPGDFNAAGGSVFDGGGAIGGNGNSIDFEYSDEIIDQTYDQLPSNREFLDRELATRVGKRFSNRLVPNRFGRGDIFGETIAQSLQYILLNTSSTTDWDADAGYRISVDAVIASLNPEFYNMARNIRLVDGRALTNKQIASMVMTRVYNNTLDDLRVETLRQTYRESSETAKTFVERSYNVSQDRHTAFRLMNANKISLDDSKLDDLSINKSFVQGYKTFATDVAKYLPIVVNGETKKYYVNDDDTFIDRSTLSITDGDFYNLYNPETDSMTKLKVQSERDHAYVVPEAVRQNAVRLCGGNPDRVLSVSAPADSTIEFDHDLSTPRKNVYILKMDPSSAEVDRGQDAIVKTKVRYTWMDQESNQGRRDINSYIRYKTNYRTIYLDDEDLIFDYIHNTSGVALEQTDFFLEGEKTNKGQPLFVRQMPWYLVIAPTNRDDLLTIGTRSKITSLDDKFERSLHLMPGLKPLKNYDRYGRFIDHSYDFGTHPDIYGVPRTQAVVKSYDPSGVDTQTLYIENKRSTTRRFISPSQSQPARKRTGFRLLKEIISELSDNYVLEVEGGIKAANIFDVISRMSFTEFHKLMVLDGAAEIIPKIKSGLIAGVRVAPAIQGAGKTSTRKTRLIQRREGAPEKDVFTVIKASARNRYILPPSQEPESRVIATRIDPPDGTAIPGRSLGSP